MPIYLLQGHALGKERAAVKTALKERIPELRETASLDVIRKPVSGLDDPVIVIAILADEDPSESNQLTEFALRHSSEVFLVLVGGEISVNDYKRLIRNGTGDWVSTTADTGEVLDIIARRRSRGSAPSGMASRLGQRPVTISFIPSAGGVGNTTLALETAACIKSSKVTRDRTICLVDLDFQTSHICDYLDSEPQLLIADFSSAPERLDEHLLESFKTRHSNGLDVFAAPRSKFLSENLNISALDALLSMIATRYDLVLIVHPLHWLVWTPQIIAACDGVVVTGINTIPCLRQISETLTHVRSSGSAALQVRIAINKCERALFGSIARRKHAELALRNEQVFFVADRPEAVQSINMGVPMVLGATAARARREFASLADFCSSLQSTRMALR